MVQQDEQDDQLFKKHTDLCNKLNLDTKVVTDSWDSFQSIYKNFVLEGDPLNWLGLSIYVSCRGTETPTVGQTTVRGNGINLTTLLRYSNLSFAKFFANINKWCEMASLNTEFRFKVKHLKDTYGVTCNTFKEFYQQFERLFVVPESQDFDQSKQHRNRKQNLRPMICAYDSFSKPVLCNKAKVFEFVWVLFLTLKGSNALYGTDLVKSFHLLYACLDLIFKNAFLDDRRDLINDDFEGLPEDWSSPAFQTPTEPPCIINRLCKSSQMVTEAMHMKLYDMKKMVQNLISNNTLIADLDALTGVLEPGKFENNLKYISKAYELQLLEKGDFDERIFLSEYKRILCEREAEQQNMKTPEGGATSFESPRNSGPVAPYTPLTAHQYLGPRDPDASPYSADKSFFEKITRLNSMISNRTNEPSPELLKLFASCTINPTEKIKGIVKRLGQKFLTEFPSNQNQNEKEVAKSRLDVGTTLFYKFIENILQNEKSIRNDISALVQRDLFYECMFSCCLEITIFSYNSPRLFPWILETLDIQAYQFVKVIELIIRSKENLCKEVIKHLNRIEETILERLAWETKSGLWNEIHNSEQGIPKFEDIALPGHLLYKDSTNGTGNNQTEAPKTPIQTPGPSASETFQSPVNQTSPVNRQLFPKAQSGLTLLQKQIDAKKSGEGPKRTGSLSLLFRKFYNLAGVRMENLCSKLNIVDNESKQKIWTVLEDSIRLTTLLKDRHLDQLLMCAVYVICKISDIQIKFEKIMRHYREQPQSNSDIYRNVLIASQKNEINEEGITVIVSPEKRNDLISFYNSVYVDVMKVHALRFGANQQTNSEIFLSPLPSGRRNLVSPSIQVVDNVFVKPLESTVPSHPIGPSFNYIFNRSPSKDLKDINKAIVNSMVSGKRLLNDTDPDLPNKRISNRKIQALVEERRSQNNTA